MSPIATRCSDMAIMIVTQSRASSSHLATARIGGRSSSMDELVGAFGLGALRVDGKAEAHRLGFAEGLHASSTSSSGTGASRGGFAVWVEIIVSASRLAHDALYSV